MHLDVNISWKKHFLFSSISFCRTYWRLYHLPILKITFLARYSSMRHNISCHRHLDHGWVPCAPSCKGSSKSPNHTVGARTKNYHLYITPRFGFATFSVARSIHMFFWIYNVANTVNCVANFSAFIQTTLQYGESEWGLFTMTILNKLQ